MWQQGDFRNTNAKVHYFQGSILSCGKRKPNQTKPNEKRNVKVMVLKKSIWKQTCQRKNAAEGRESNQDQEKWHWLPALPSPTPGVTKAAAVSERSPQLRYSEGIPEAVGETQITWNWCGEVTGFYMDLCFRKTKEAQTKHQTKPNSHPQEICPPT